MNKHTYIDRVRKALELDHNRDGYLGGVDLIDALGEIMVLVADMMTMDEAAQAKQAELKRRREAYEAEREAYRKEMAAKYPEPPDYDGPKAGPFMWRFDK